MRLAIIGTGNIGGTLGVLLTKAGHDARFGHRSEAGSVQAAIAHGDAIIFAGYFGGWREFAQTNAEALADKVVIDAANPYGERDGAVVADVAASGTGSAAFVAKLLPGAHVAKAFNTLYWVDLRDRSRTGKALPVAADEPAASLAAELVRDAGYEPVIYPLANGAWQDPDAVLYNKVMDADEIRLAIQLADVAPSRFVSAR